MKGSGNKINTYFPTSGTAAKTPANYKKILLAGKSQVGQKLPPPATPPRVITSEKRANALISGTPDKLHSPVPLSSDVGTSAISNTTLSPSSKEFVPRANNRNSSPTNNGKSNAGDDSDDGYDSMDAMLDGKPAPAVNRTLFASSSGTNPFDPLSVDEDMEVDEAHQNGETSSVEEVFYVGGSDGAGAGNADGLAEDTASEGMEVEDFNNNKHSAHVASLSAKSPTGTTDSASAPPTSITWAALLQDEGNEVTPNPCDHTPPTTAPSVNPDLSNHPLMSTDAVTPSALKPSSFSKPLEQADDTVFPVPTSERVTLEGAYVSLPLREDVGDLTYAQVGFQPKDGVHPTAVALEGFRELLLMAQRVDATFVLHPVHNNSGKLPLTTTKSNFPTIFAELAQYYRVQNSWDTVAARGSDQNGKQKVQRGLYGTALFASTMDPMFIQNCIRGDLDSMGISFQVKQVQGLVSRSDLAIISCHVDVDPAGLKQALVPFLWAAEVGMWKSNRNMKWKEKPQPDFLINLRGAKEPKLTKDHLKKDGIAKFEASLKRIFQIEMTDTDIPRMKPVFKEVESTGILRKVAGKKCHLVGIGLSGARCESTRQLFSRKIKCHIGYNLKYESVKIFELENPGMKVEVQMEDKSAPKPYFETTVRKELMHLQVPDTRFVIDQVVPVVGNTDEGSCVIVYKRDPTFQKLISKITTFPAAWCYWYLKLVRGYNDGCVNRLIIGSFSGGCLAEAMDATWDADTWTVHNPHHATVHDTYFDDHLADGIDIDKLDVAQMLEDKAEIDKGDNSDAIKRVTEMYRIKDGDTLLNSNSAASAKTGATGTTGGDNRSVRSVTSTDVKTNYKRNAAALATTKSQLATQKQKLDQQSQEIEELKARLGRMSSEVPLSDHV